MFFKNKNALYILLITFIGLLLRLYKLHNNDFWLDEVYTVIVSNFNFPQMMERVIANSQPPLYYLLMHFWIKYFNFSDYFLDIPSVIFGVITIYVVYLLAKEIFTEKTALFSALFFSLSPVAVFFCKEARPYSLLILFTTLSALYFLKFINEGNNKKNWFLYVIFTTLAFYSHYVFGYFLVPQYIFIIIYKRKHFFRFLLLQIGFFILLLPWLPSFIKQLNVCKETVVASQSINFLTILGLLNIIHHIKVEINLLAMVPLRIIIPIMVFASVVFLFKKKEEKHIFLIFYLILPIATAISLSIIWKPIFIDRQISPALVPYFIFLSAGIHNILKYDLDQKIISIFVSIMLLIALSLTVYKWDNRSYSKAVNYINKHYKKGEYIITLEEADTVPIIYYNKHHIPHFILPKYSSNHIDTRAFKFPSNFCKYFNNVTELKQVINSKMKIYLISSPEGLKREKVKELIKLIQFKNFKLKYTKQIQHLILFYYSPN